MSKNTVVNKNILMARLYNWNNILTIIEGKRNPSWQTLNYCRQKVSELESMLECSQITKHS